MLDLAKLPVQQAVAVLARFAAGRVNSYTALVGEAMGLTFIMGAGGRARMDEALSKLPAINTIGKTIEIGFGIEDVVRILAKSAGGTMILGLCAALKECYSDDMAVEVLLEYARATKADKQFMPSNMEWRALLDACAGALAASNFSLQAEHFMQLAKGERRLGVVRSLHENRKSRLPDTLRGISAPKAIAEGLAALAKISIGSMESVTIHGGPDAGWLASIAGWLLDLRVVIMSEGESQPLYVNVADHENAQVRIVYNSPTSRVETPDTPRSSSSIDASRPKAPQYDDSRDGLPTAKRAKLADQAEYTMQIGDKKYCVELGEMSNLFMQYEDSTANVVAGRVEWKIAFRSTFLSDFENLMRVPETLGSMLGAAARLFQAITCAEEPLTHGALRTNRNYCEAAHGPGFIANAIKWFPELSKLRSFMETALKKSFSNARKEHELCISILRKQCDCAVCHHTEFNGFGPEFQGDRSDDLSQRADGNSDSCSDSIKSADHWDPNRYCHVVMAETIIILCRALANCSIGCETLCPMRSGLELAYSRCLELRTEFQPGEKDDPGPIVFCMDFDTNFFNSGNEDTALELSLIILLELFAGRKAMHSSEKNSALWMNGITAFANILRSDRLDDTHDACGIVVIPGRIQFEGKSYTCLTDRQETETTHGRSRNAHRGAVQGFSTAGEFTMKRLSVRETATHLQCVIEFFRDEPWTGAKPTRVGPWDLRRFVSRNRGLIPCRSSIGRSCKRDRGPQKWPQKKVDDRIVEVQMDTQRVLFVSPYSNSNALALVASALTRFGARAESLYIIDRQCQSCCLRFVESHLGLIESSHYFIRI